MKRLDNIDAQICTADATVRTVITRIDASTPHLFQVIVDPAGHLLGTVTDGDIRRAMLHGLTLESPAADCMNRNSKFGRIGDDAGNAALLQRLSARARFLPLVDADGVVRAILVEGGESASIVTALVMAGGLGRRLGEITRSRPKPLVEVGGRPMLDHVLGRLEDAGVRRIFVAIHYLADQIENFVGVRRNRAEIQLVREEVGLGTAGALRLLPPAALAHPILVSNADVMTQVDFAALADFHGRHGHEGTIAVAQHELKIPFGVVRYDEAGLFANIEEKPSVVQFVAAGVYYLSPLFASLVPRQGAFDMPDLLNAGKRVGMRIGLFPIHEPWADIGRPDDLESADAVLGRSGRRGAGS